MGLTLYLLYGVLVLKGSDFFWMCGTLERAYSMEQIQGHLRKLIQSCAGWLFGEAARGSRIDVHVRPNGGIAWMQSEFWGVNADWSAVSRYKLGDTGKLFSLQETSSSGGWLAVTLTSMHQAMTFSRGSTSSRLQILLRSTFSLLHCSTWLSVTLRRWASLLSPLLKVAL